MTIRACSLGALQSSELASTFSYQCRTNIAFHSSFTLTQKKQKRQSLSASASTPSRLKRCVMVAFIFVTALVAVRSISVLMPWQRCMIKAPASMPFLRCCNEGKVMSPACPRGVYVRVRVEDVGQILPFASIAGNALVPFHFRLNRWIRNITSAYRYIGQPSASSLSLYRSMLRLSGPLWRTALFGLDPAGSECRSGAITVRTALLSYSPNSCEQSCICVYSLLNLQRCGGTVPSGTRAARNCFHPKLEGRLRESRKFHLSELRTYCTTRLPVRPSRVLLCYLKDSSSST